MDIEKIEKLIDTFNILANHLNYSGITRESLEKLNDPEILEDFDNYQDSVSEALKSYKILCHDEY